MAYDEIRTIGEGGFGIVREARDDDGNLWAIKTFRPPPGIDPAPIKKRFEKEVKYQSRIDHPNVVRIVASNLDDDPPFFVMELAKESLARELDRDHTLGGSPGDALFDILTGLEALHSLGITHRDLKPGNVLKFVNAEGAVRYAISDFGLITAAESETTTITQSNFAAGTPYYAAPECAVDFKRATAQSDIYSFGAILHDIFLGAQRVPHTELTAPQPIGPIIEKCTKTLPLRRYQSVGELRVDLYEAINRADLTFESDEEEEIVGLLRDNSSLDDDAWDRVFLFLDDHESDESVVENVFQALSISHIRQLRSESPELLSAMGRAYCEHVQHGAFDFGYCDVLATKVEEFFDQGQVDIKALAIISLLCMGTSHNRWYVEHKFMRLAGPDLNEDVAERVRIEIDIQELDFESLISHVEDSISASRDSLHLMLQEIL